MPREFVFMDRAAIGLGAVFLHLAAELNFHRLFNEAIEDFSVEGRGPRQRRAGQAGLTSRLTRAASVMPCFMRHPNVQSRTSKTWMR